MKHEDYNLPDCCPQFNDEEKTLLNEAGFGWLGIQDGYARFRHTDIENLHLSTKVFIRKGAVRRGPFLVDWCIYLYGGKDRMLISHKLMRKRFPSVQAALDWLGTFAGQRTYPVFALEFAPAS